MSSKEFTKEEVAKHNTESNCYIIINNDVYDCTKFLNEHPVSVCAHVL